MWDVEDIKEACDRIERNTVYGAFECCQHFFSSIMKNIEDRLMGSINLFFRADTLTIICYTF